MTVTEKLLSQADLDWWTDLAPGLRWRVAKTMPKWPHSYVVRNQMLDDPDFEKAVRVIRTFGEPGKFYDRTNIYLTRGNIKWWTMGEPLDECQIINQADTEKVYGTQDAPHTASGRFSVYDGLAQIYDNRYTTDEDRKENEAVRRLISRHFGAYAPSVLDVGAGTGLVLDLGITAPGLYTGVDPSQGMLNELIRKHPRVRNVVPKTMEEAVDDFGPRQFEAVLALFGSASYIDPQVLAELPGLSRALTVFMHYEAGYLPDYWAGLPQPPHVDSSREMAHKLKGRTFRLNRFEVTVING